MDDNLFEIIDKRGILVICEESQWKIHITGGHPEVEDKLEIVKNTIKEPDIIYQSEEDSKRDVYFKEFENNKYMKVIVELTSPNFGEVITAFPRKGISGNIDTEAIKYVKNKLWRQIRYIVYVDVW